jgi:hypothetical protein
MLRLVPPLLPTPTSYQKQLIHLSNQFVNIAFPISKVTALNKVLELARPPAARGVGEFERP